VIGTPGVDPGRPGAYPWGMRSALVRLSVLAILALGLGFEGVAFADRASSCVSLWELSPEPPPCCQRRAPVRILEEGGDCCQTLDVNPADPAAMAEAHEVAATPAVALPAGVRRLPAPRAAYEPWREALERGPPYPPATENIVLLN
jgi:hypothetical protein